MSGMPEAWEFLHLNFNPANDEDMIQLGRLIWMNMVETVWDQCLDTPDHENSFTEKGKRFVAAASAWIGDRLRRGNQDDDLKRILNRCKKAGVSIYDGRENPGRTISPLKIAYHLWKETFATDLNQLALMGPKNEKSFHTMFVQKNEYMDTAKSILKESPVPLTIGELAELLSPGEYGTTIQQLIEIRKTPNP